MNSILRIYVSSTLNVAAQHTKVLTVTLYLTPNISTKMICLNQGSGDF